MKSEEKSIQAISAQAHSEAADNRLLRKKLQARDRRVVELEAMVSNLNKQLCEKVDQLNDMMQKLVAFMTGNGEVNLSDSLREAVVAGVRAEFEAREQKLKETYARELEKRTSDFNARLAAKQNEINQLKGIKDEDRPTTTMPSGSNSDSSMSAEAKLKSSEQQKTNLQVTAYGQHTESAKCHHGSQQTENADDLDLNGENVPDEKIVCIAKELKERVDMKGGKKPRREQPLFDAAIGGENDITLSPDNLPPDAVDIGEDVSVRYTYVKGFIRTYIIRRKKYKDSKGKYYHVNLPDEYKNCMGRTQVTESLVAQVLTMHFYYHITIGDIEAWLKSMGLNYSHATVVGWIEIGANILEPLDDPLHKEIIATGNVHADESTLGCKDQRLPGKGETVEDVEDELHFFKRWIFCYHAPLSGLTQFVFHERGRRTQEAVKKYFEDVVEKIYLHSDGAPIYKCYDVGELIQRIACLVHMRRPFFKLKDFSKEAMTMLELFEAIFREDKLIKAKFSTPDDIQRERLLRIGPMFNDMKAYLDKLAKNLEKEEEPELLKAVNYALAEYPCMLRCLKDGNLDLSNNVCERQIRRVAKYRNNSYFVGSPEAGVRFARLMSHFANIRRHNLDPLEYLCDVFRRIKTTAKDKLTDLLAHKWYPATAAVWE